MKVLRFVRLVFIIVITSLSLAACNEDSNSTAPIFYIDSSLEEGLIFGGEGGEQFIKFGCSMDWNLQISSPNNDMTWCTPSMTSGKAGNYNVKFTVTKNTDENERFVYVNIFAGTSTITFIITQHKKNTEDDVEKPTISLSQESFNVETRGGIIKVDVESNVQYMIQMPDIDWITEMTDNTKASNSHYFAISENPLLTDRNADILFVTQELDTLATVVIEQRANNFITVNSTEAGSLLGIIGAEHIEDVTGLKVIGDINGNDIVLIKRMTNLINLDLSQSRIVEGGVSYGKKDIHYTIPIYIDDEKHPQVDAYTENDIIGENMFENCNFKSIKLPNSSKKIDARAFKNCLLLKNVNIPKSVNYISWFAFSGYNPHKHTLVIGAPVSGKTTLIMQVAYQISGYDTKLIFNDLTKTKSEYILKILGEQKALIFIENFTDEVDAFIALSKAANINLVGIDRSHSFETVSNYFSEDHYQIINVTELSDNDVQEVYNMLPIEVKRDSLQKGKSDKYQRDSIFEFVIRNIKGENIKERYKSILAQMEEDDRDLAVFLILCAYMHYCRVPLSMEVAYSFFSNTYDYKYVYEIKEKLSDLLNEFEEEEAEFNIDYYYPRSFYIADIILRYSKTELLAEVMHGVVENVPQIQICSYNKFKKFAFDKELVLQAFPRWKDGVSFYEKAFLYDYKKRHSCKYPWLIFVV